MIEMSNLDAEQLNVAEPMSEDFSRLRTRDAKTGKFIAGLLSYGNGVSISETRIEKAFGAKMPSLPKPAGNLVAKPKANLLPKPVVPMKTPVPGTKAPSKPSAMVRTPKPQTVGKSYVPGKGWVKAATTTPSDRIKIRRGLHSKMRKPSATDENYRAGIKETQTTVTNNTKTTGTMGVGRGRKATTRHGDMGGTGMLAFAYKTGGRRSGGTMVAGDRATKATLTHEHAHLTPNRSGYRLNQITQSPKKSAREEARADFTAGIRYGDNTTKRAAKRQVKRGKESGYAYTAGRPSLNFKANAAIARKMNPDAHPMMKPGFQKEYRDTQDKIARAKGMKTDRAKYRTMLGVRYGGPPAAAGGVAVADRKYGSKKK